jgi:hypothetical protein
MVQITNETYAPVAKMESVKILLSIVALNDLELCQADMKQAFLRPELEENVILQPPWLPFGNNKKLWKLKKALYGLKQSARSWNKEADEKLRRLGFVPCLADPCIYVRLDDQGKPFYIALYVDDLLYAHHDMKVIQSVHAQLEGFWKDLKWIGKAEFFLGMRVTRNRFTKQIHINQERIIIEALDLASMTGCNPAKTPYDSNICLCKASAGDKILSQDMKELYHTLVGKLSYVATNTRPDLAVIASQLGSFVSNPTDIHFGALKRVLRYCSGTFSHGLVLGGLDSTLPVLVG